MIVHKSDANHLIIVKVLWRGSKLAFVADSGLWIGHGIALVAGNRYKGESRNTAILYSTKNALVPKSRGMKFRCLGLLITLLLGFWCFVITFLLKIV